ncbi:MAG: hypothetical protein AAF499_03230 [Pseudomonadota bacterium]
MNSFLPSVLLFLAGFVVSGFGAAVLAKRFGGSRRGVKMFIMCLSALILPTLLYAAFYSISLAVEFDGTCPQFQHDPPRSCGFAEALIDGLFLNVLLIGWVIIAPASVGLALGLVVPGLVRVYDSQRKPD